MKKIITLSEPDYDGIMAALRSAIDISQSPVDTLMAIRKIHHLLFIIRSTLVTEED
jgi:hypothetical protein